MTIKPIRNDDDLKRVFRRLEKIFQAGEGTPQADERDVLVTLVEAYENKHYDFGPATRWRPSSSAWSRRD
jgi:HTH-type transcriptional regulator/antitoxin HigA